MRFQIYKKIEMRKYLSLQLMRSKENLTSYSMRKHLKMLLRS